MAFQRGPRFEPNKAIVFQKVADISQLSGKAIAQWAGHTAEALVKGDRLKTHQLRNIYSSIERLRTMFQNDKTSLNELEDELFLILPKLAYAAGRQRAVNATLFPFIKNAIDAVEGAEGEKDRKKAFKNFFVLIESVVGYHKYFEKNRDGKLHI